jgi:hypothetical protein
MKKAQEIRNSLIEISNDDRLLIIQALEILIEDIENDMIDDSWNSQYRQELLVKFNELYERL